MPALANTGEVAMELNKELMDCMIKLRRLLREELNLNIRLSEPDSSQQLFNASQKSALGATRELGLRLAKLAELPLPVREIETVPMPGSVPTAYRVYRGQRIYS